MSGEDEQFTLPTCLMLDGFRSVPLYATCSDVFLCNQVERDFLELSQLCDGNEDCGEEGSVCKVASSDRTTELFTTPTMLEHRVFMFHCLPGLKSMELLAGTCTEETFRSPDYPVFGATATSRLVFPNSTVKCEYVFGEISVFLSCMNKCAATSCFLKSLRHDSCSNVVQNRVYSLAKNNYITLVTEQRGQYLQKHFLCDNNKCVSYDKVCNLVNDCGDHSDESSCRNFQCSTTKSYIEKSRKCDGTIDCKDFSDECNENCSMQIVSGVFLKVISWFLGTSAVFLNTMILQKGIFQPWKKGTASRINGSITLLVATGDLLTGLYLLLIAITDSFIMHDTYCTKKFYWLSSFYCAALGTVSTIGAYMSLFSMTYLSVFRTISIKTKGMVYGRRLIKFKITTIVFSVITASATISLVPLIVEFDDTFVNGLVYDDKLRLFFGSSNKQTHMDVIKSYYGKVTQTYLSWKEIVTLINMMFTDNYKQITSPRKTHFYGNEGVCLFKYFVKSSDPQRIFVWSTLAINIACFAVISLSYIFLQVEVRNTTRSVQAMMEKQGVKSKEKKTDKLQRKITLIIMTDFFCWIPFVFTAGLHTLDIIDATFLYSFFSIVLLPINSVINPILYDDFITNKVCNLMTIVRAKLSIFEKVFSSSKNNVQPEATISRVVKPSTDTVNLSTIFFNSRKISVEIEKHSLR